MNPATSPLPEMLRTSEAVAVRAMTKRLGDEHQARHTVTLSVRAELLGARIDAGLDHDQWLAEHAKLSLTYLERFYAPALAALPLDLRSYPADLRDDVATAVADVLDAEPVPAEAHTPLYPPVDHPAELPANCPRVFALTGLPRTGKDVVADYIQARYRNVTRFAFSDAIVDEANAFVGQFGHTICEANKSHPYYRHLLQAFGMGRRAEDEHYWTKQVQAKVRRAWDDGARLVIVTGARMPSDHEVITVNLGGEMWRVIRPGNDYQFAKNASAAVESGLDALPDSAFRDILNPVEGDLAPYEANIEQALRARR